MDRMIGVIGGSGLYAIEGLEDTRWTEADTPWGQPSDRILTGRLGGRDIAFLPRHGRGHVRAPATVPYQANIAALKRIGVTDVVSVSACGSFREEMAPGDFVIVDQFIDRTAGRPASFFGDGCVAHVNLAHPTCARLRAACAEAARSAGATVHDGGTYLAIEGPQFGTLAESRLYREVWGCDVVGMTNMPEARLAREAELCYATVAMVTDYDSWHPDHDEVDVAAIVATLTANVGRAREAIARMPPYLGEADACPAGCDRALDTAILTAPDARDPQVVERLSWVAGRVLAS